MFPKVEKWIQLSLQYIHWTLFAYSLVFRRFLYSRCFVLQPLPKKGNKIREVKWKENNIFNKVLYGTSANSVFFLLWYIKNCPAIVLTIFSDQFSIVQISTSLNKLKLLSYLHYNTFLDDKKKPTLAIFAKMSTFYLGLSDRTWTCDT